MYVRSMINKDEMIKLQLNTIIVRDETIAQQKAEIEDLLKRLKQRDRALAVIQEIQHRTINRNKRILNSEGIHNEDDYDDNYQPDSNFLA